MPFAFLGLAEPLLQVLRDMAYQEPTPIQRQAVPEIMQGKDLVGQAQTGSGKTAAFALPILNHLSKFIYKKDKPIRALILVPTRELANQVNEAIRHYGSLLSPKLQSTAVFGGVGIEAQENKLKRGMDILVATPGRLLDLHAKGVIKLHKLQFLVLDEADRMLDMGFTQELRQIRQLVPEKRQTLLFSATFNEGVENLVYSMTRKATQIRIEANVDESLDIEHLAYPVLNEDKFPALLHLLRSNRFKQVVIFVATKERANEITNELRKNHIKTAIMHGDFSQQDRIEALKAMKEGRVTAMVATDLAARGIDIPELPCVINYDFPATLDDYIHRTGRTGRAGNSGIAISLVQGTSLVKVREFASDLGLKLKVSALAHFKKAPQVIEGAREKVKPKIVQRQKTPEQAPAKKSPFAPKFQKGPKPTEKKSHPKRRN